MSKPRIAFLGLGLMGSGMARQLLSKGFPITVFNRSAEKAQPLAAAGANVASSPREAATQADVIISMVADDPASRAMWLGGNGALASTATGALLIECSTLTVNWIKELAASAATRQCELLDAPVTGSRIPATTGELNFLVGGSAETLEKARPVLSAMGKSIIHVGPTGSGALIKLINNFLCGVQAASLAEALAMIERSGLERTPALEVLLNGAPGSPIMKILAGRMTASDFAPNFLLRLMSKDLGYAIEAGGKIHLPLTTANAALNVFKQAMANGDSDEDMSAVIKQFRSK